MEKKDLIGMVVYKLTVVADAEFYVSPTNGKRLRQVVCLCECGNKVTVLASNLIKMSHTRSCGCIRGLASVKHGDANKTKEYRAWSHMKNRCYNKNDPKYSDYGGRGINVCDRWRYNYKAFLEDIGRAKTPDLSIDRINNNGNYEPGNCRWATKSQQARNQRKRSKICGNIFYIEGEKMNMKILCEKLCIAKRTILRYLNNYSIYDIIKYHVPHPRVSYVKKHATKLTLQQAKEINDISMNRSSWKFVGVKKGTKRSKLLPVDETQPIIKCNISGIGKG